MAEETILGIVLFWMRVNSGVGCMPLQFLQSTLPSAAPHAIVKLLTTNFPRSTRLGSLQRVDRVHALAPAFTSTASFHLFRVDVGCERRIVCR